MMYPITIEIIPAYSCKGTISILGYFLIISIKIAKEIGITNAAILPVICPLERSDPTIKIIPDIAKIIDAKVTFEIFSFKKK